MCGWYTSHLTQVLQRLFPVMIWETAQIHELIMLNKALTFNLTEVFYESEAVKSWIKPATENITSLKELHLYVSQHNKSKSNILNCCFESLSFRWLYLSFSPPTLTDSITKYFSDNILHNWILPNLEHLMFIDDYSFIAALFTFLSNIKKTLQNLVINCWYLENQFDKKLIYDENEQQLQIYDEMLKNCVIWEIRELEIKEIEEDSISDMRLRLLQIKVKNKSVEITLFKPVRTETIA